MQRIVLTIDPVRRTLEIESPMPPEPTIVFLLDAAKQVALSSLKQAKGQAGKVLTVDGAQGEVLGRRFHVPGNGREGQGG